MGALLRRTTPDGDEREWAMPMEMLARDGTPYRSRLLQQGVIIEPSKLAREKLHSYITRCHPKARYRAVPRIGWYDDIFVLPDQIFGGVEVDMLRRNRRENR